MSDVSSTEKNIVLSVVVPTRNQRPGLIRLLETLDLQYLSSDLYEVLVVDDHSDDDTAEHVKPLYTRYRLIYIKSRGEGLLAARNHGTEEASGDYVLFLSDTLLAPSTLLEAHHLAHKEHPHRVIRGPVLPLASQEVPMLESPPPAVQLSFTAVNASLSKMALYKVGGFDERLDPAVEDREIGWRLHQDGWTEEFLRGCYAWYHRPESEGGILADLKEQALVFARSAVAHYSKHPDKSVALATGIHPMRRASAKVTANDLVMQTCRALHESRAAENIWVRTLLEQQIYMNYYFRFLAQELKEQGLE